jgi:hypothetical protein
MASTHETADATGQEQKEMSEPTVRSATTVALPLTKGARAEDTRAEPTVSEVTPEEDETLGAMEQKDLRDQDEGEVVEELREPVDSIAVGDEPMSHDSPMALSWDDADSISPLEDLPSSGEEEAPADEEVVETVPLTPLRGDREGETSAADRRSMEGWLLRYWDSRKAAYVRVKAENRSKV